MWNPPIALTPEEQKTAARTRKTRKFFVLLREQRHERLDADFQHTLAESYAVVAVNGPMRSGPSYIACGGSCAIPPGATNLRLTFQ